MSTPPPTQETPAPETGLKQGRVDATGPAGPKRFWEQAAFQPSVALVTALLAGAVLAPDLWAVGTVAVDDALLGTPAAEDIKSTANLEIEDRETTERLREEAAKEVRPVFDLDLGLGKRLGEQIRAAFAISREAVDSALNANPKWLATEKIRASERRKRDEAIATALQSKRDQLVEALGGRLSEQHVASIEATGFVPEAVEPLVDAVERWMRVPMVDSTESLQRLGDRGIEIQRVPVDDKPTEVRQNVETIRSVAARKKTAATWTQQQAQMVPESLHGVLVAALKGLAQANLTLNRADTEIARAEARLSVKAATLSVQQGEMIIRDGERYNRRHLLFLQALQKGADRSSGVVSAIGVALLLLTVAWSCFLGLRLGRRRRGLTARDTLFLALLFLLFAVGVRLWLAAAVALSERYTAVPVVAYIYLMPVAAGTLVTRLVLRRDAALIFAMVGTAVMGMVMAREPLVIVYCLVGSIAAATVIRNVAARSDVLRAGVIVGGVQAVAAVGLLMFDAQTGLYTYLTAVPAAFIGGAASGFLALAITPVFESAFDYTTDLKLLELANLNHPALKDLIVQAPGSYHHSIIVGTLAERAAEATGANPLLAKVMAYYHDLGKGCNAPYFIENQRGKNPHDKLKPSMSAMVIRRHVTDGLEIAKRYGLGDVILAGIAEHHGTTLIHYFYAKAKENAEEGEHINEQDYRYPGRKPQTRESALVMLADSVEAASRSLGDPTVPRLKGLVNKIINMKFTDGQLDECDLTLKDLHRIAKSFIDVLTSIYHQRVEYPELGAKKDADSDPKQEAPSAPAEPAAEEDRPDNIRRLGLS